MIKYLIFDLSEVLIRGILGVEVPLSKVLNRSQKSILDGLCGVGLEDLCRGKISENTFLKNVIIQEKWSIEITELKKYLRQNFQIKIDKMPELIKLLSSDYDIILMTDHCREWIKYIEDQHEFMKLFSRKYFSFKTGLIKSDQEAFSTLMQIKKLDPEEVLFIDDNPNNIWTAEQVGIRGILFKDQTQFEKSLSLEN
jgi:phosphoglycolate phosphatase-like HAD superfamily hydrolase